MKDFAAAYRSGIKAARDAYRKDFGLSPLTGCVIFAVELISYHIRSGVIALIVFVFLGPFVRLYTRRLMGRR